MALGTPDVTQCWGPIPGGRTQKVPKIPPVASSPAEPRGRAPGRGSAGGTHSDTSEAAGPSEGGRGRRDSGQLASLCWPLLAVPRTPSSGEVSSPPGDTGELCPVSLGGDSAPEVCEQEVLTWRGRGDGDSGAVVTGATTEHGASGIGLVSGSSPLDRPGTRQARSNCAIVPQEVQ